MQTRDFVAVQDIVDAIHKAILYDKNGTYNIASGKSVTIKELAEFMISLSGKNLKIQYVAPKKGDIRHSQADITLAKKELKYSPKVGLKEIKNLFIVA
jgi:UDP-glucose 4-epimerase